MEKNPKCPEPEPKKGRLPSFFESCFALAVTLGILLYFNVYFDAAQVGLFMCGIVLSGFAAYLGWDWNSIEEMLLSGLKIGLGALLINVYIGFLIAALSAAGTIAYIVSLGFDILSPGYFLVVTCLTCTFMALGTGSAWTTAGTVGIALFGVGTSMGIPGPMIIGAILSGTYLGDKMSIISESCVLVSALSEVSIIKHLYSMLYVVVPTVVIALVTYAIMGYGYKDLVVDTAALQQMGDALNSRFTLNPICLLPLALLIFLIIRKTSPDITLVAGVISACILAIAMQDVSFKSMLSALMSGFKPETGLPHVDKMLSKGGLNSMSSTIQIMMLGLPVGGVLKGTGMLDQIVYNFANYLRTTAQAITAATMTVLLGGAVTADTYASYILTTTAYKPVFDKLKLERYVLSRVCDMGVVCNCLFPWTAGGMFYSQLFGISPLVYAPYYVWGIAMPLVIIFCGVTGWGIFYTNGRKGWGKNKYIPPKDNREAA